MTTVRYGARSQQVNREIEAKKNADIWSEAVTAVYETEPDIVAAVLPPPLEPGPEPLVRVTITRVEMPGLPVFGAGWIGVQARPEGRRRHAGDGVGIGEHDLGGDTVSVELLVALFDVPGAAQTLFVLGLPPHDVVVIHLELLVAVGLALRKVLVELRVVRGVEVWPVLLTVQPGVGVGRNDRVAVAHRFAPNTERSS